MKQGCSGSDSLVFELLFHDSLGDLYREPHSIHHAYQLPILNERDIGGGALKDPGGQPGYIELVSRFDGNRFGTQCGSQLTDQQVSPYIHFHIGFPARLEHAQPLPEYVQRHDEFLVCGLNRLLWSWNALSIGAIHRWVDSRYSIASCCRGRHANVTTFAVGENELLDAGEISGEGGQNVQAGGPSRFSNTQVYFH